MEAQIPKFRHQERRGRAWPLGPVETGTRSWAVVGGGVDAGSANGLSEPVSGLVLCSLVDISSWYVLIQS